MSYVTLTDSALEVFKNNQPVERQLLWSSIRRVSHEPRAGSPVRQIKSPVARNKPESPYHRYD